MVNLMLIGVVIGSAFMTTGAVLLYINARQAGTYAFMLGLLLAFSGALAFPVYFLAKGDFVQALIAIPPIIVMVAFSLKACREEHRSQTTT